MSNDQFRQAEEQFFLLKGQQSAGRITREQFDAALKQLMIQDAQGRFWMIGADTGEWFVHDGQNWVRANPPAPAVARPTSLPERAAPGYAPSRPPPVFAPPERVAPRGRVSSMWVFAAGVAMLGLIVFACVVLFITRGLPSTVSQIPPSLAPTPPPPPLATPPVGVVQATATPSPTTISVTAHSVATSEPPKLLAPQEFAASSASLANAIADLNRAELKFIRDAKATFLNQRLPGLALLALFAPDPLDDDLREIAARAFLVAQTAGTLGLTAVAQDGGSDAAGQTADQYYSIARLGYALVIETQNLREGLPAGTVTRGDAINTIAEYGARLWNPAVTDPAVKGNPFLPNVKDTTMVAPMQFLSASAAAQLKTQMGAGKTVQTWLATSQEVVTKTLMLPAPRAPVSNPFDPILLKTLTTARGQSDADRARQAAAVQLTVLTAPSAAPTQIQFAAFKSASIAEANQIAAGAVPSFARGKASALARQAAGAQQLINDLYDLGGENSPTIQATTPVREMEPVAAIRITSIRLTKISPPPPALPQSASFEVDVYWQSGSMFPKVLEIGCGGGKAIRVTTTSGNARLTATDPVSDLGWAFVYCSMYELPTKPDQVGFEMGFRSLAADHRDVMIGDPDRATKTAAAWHATDTAVWATRDARDSAEATQALAAQTQQAQSLATQRAVGTQVAASKTAEFRATVTAIAQQTKQAVSVYTMNGTFSLNFLPVGWCEPGYDEPSFGTNTAGTIKITVDFKSGAASGSLKGGGSRGTYKVVGCDGSISWDQTSRIDYEGTLNGTVDPATGALSLLSVADLKYELSVANCRYRDGKTCSISPRTGLPNKLPIIITGTVDKATHTGKGTVTVRNCLVKDHCVGDWHAGE